MTVDLLRYAQIEITTHCNFSCFYCAGRTMPQRHMSLELFNAILATLPARALTVSLQGEGEPMLHPSFWEMVRGIRNAGHVPFTITNGSAMPYPERIASDFFEIGISIDTLDGQIAQEIGRLQLDRVLTNLDRLLEHMLPARVIVYTVDMGQPLDALKTFLAQRGLRHVVQPLQRKEDYLRNYSDRVPARTTRPAARCDYVRRSFMRYFNIDGTQMPCPFIKDTSGYQGLAWLRNRFDRQSVPPCCAGCSELGTTSSVRQRTRSA